MQPFHGDVILRQCGQGVLLIDLLDLFWMGTAQSLQQIAHVVLIDIFRCDSAIVILRQIYIL